MRGYGKLMASSQSLGWKGLQLEIAKARGVYIEDLAVNGHLIGFNVSNATIRLETRSELLQWKSSHMPPKSFWINPEGRPYSVRHKDSGHIAACLVDGRFLDSVMGQHFELKGGIGVVDKTLAHILQAMIANLENGEYYSPELATKLNNTVVYSLATRHGYPADEISFKGGIAPCQLKSLTSWLENNVDKPITVAMMADQVGLSLAHFSREFKRSTNHTPWEYFVELRLNAAHELLSSGASVTTAATRAGFSDQPHLSRLFKRRFGITPSSLNGTSPKKG